MAGQSLIIDIKEKIAPFLLVFITLYSWFIFPHMLKALNNTIFSVGFAMCLRSVLVPVFSLGGP